MSRFAMILMCLFCVAVPAQDLKDERVHKACLAVPKLFLKCQSTGPYLTSEFHSTDLRYSSPQEFARNAKVGDRWWPGGSGAIAVTFAASAIDRDTKAMMIRLKGNAEIHTVAMSVEADEADYYLETGEIEARGNVRVKPVVLPWPSAAPAR
jgi:lipopolysaccharide assembly outer membrane protein LptD (OstA)